MPLRGKTLTIVFLLTAVLVLVLYSSTQTIVVSNVAEAEEQHTRGDVDRALNVLSTELSNLDTMAHDWASWDDTYAYVVDANPEYVKSNLADKTFIDLKINLLTIVDSSGRIVFEKAFDPENAGEVPILSELKEQLAPNEPLLHHTSTNSSLVGVLILGGTPTLIASRPILTSLGQGPIRGALIMGIFLNPSEISTLSDAFHGQIVVHEVSDSQIPSDFQTALASLSKATPTVVRPLSDKRVAGYALLDDIYGDPALILRIDEPRDFYVMSQTIMTYLALSLVVACATFAGVTMLGLEKLVLSPLTKLSADVSRIASSGSRSNRVLLKGGDEFSSLATTINAMLQSRERMEEASSRLAAIVESSGDAIIGKTLDGVIQSWNEGAKKIYGYSAEEVLGKSISLLIPPNRPDELKEILERIRKGEGVEYYETERVRKDGKIINVSLAVSPIKDSAGVTIGASTIARDITERKLAEEALRTSEMKYRMLVANIPHGIYQTSSEGKLLTVNPALVHLLGYDSDTELLAVNVEQDLYVNPQDRKRWMGELERRGEIRDVELVLRRKDGDQLTVLDNAHVVRDERGAILYHEGTITDITERNRMEEELRRSNQFLETLIETLPDPVYLVDRDYRHVMVNEALARLVALPKEKVIGKTDYDLYPKEVADAFRKKDEEFFEKGVATEVAEETLIDAQGKTHIMHTKKSPLRDSAGNVTHLLGVTRDITRRKQMEQELERYSGHLEELVKERTQKLSESEQRFRELANLLPQIVFETDEKGNLTFGNQAGFAATGYGQADIDMGLNASQLFVAEKRTQVQDRITKILGGETSAGSEYLARRKDGSTFPVIMHVTAIVRENRPVGLRGIAIDITDRKRMEEQLLKAERFSAIGETVMMVGHDLRNPLQVMVNSLALWEEICNSMPPQCRNIADERGLNRLFQRVGRQLEYMNKIVSDLQDYARPVKPEVASIDVLRFVKETLSTVTIPENTKVAVNSTEGVGEVMLDPILMKRVLTNLITNAIQAMPSGGALTITVSKREGFASIDLQDTGVGIPEENLARIFQPLFTTKSKGQGLGLAVCRRLVEAHGGNITVKSKVGVGTTFIVNLPSQ